MWWPAHVWTRQVLPNLLFEAKHAGGSTTLKLPHRAAQQWRSFAGWFNHMRNPYAVLTWFGNDGVKNSLTYASDSNCVYCRGEGGPGPGEGGGGDGGAGGGVGGGGHDGGMAHPGGGQQQTCVPG